MRLTPRVAGFRSEYPAGFKLECMAGFVGTRSLRVTAETCRRLVGAVNDAETVARLTDLAEECERKLSAMADHFDGGSTD